MRAPLISIPIKFSPKHAPQANGVLAFATTQFQDNGVVIIKVCMPFPFKRKPFLRQLLITELENVAVRFHVCELGQLVFCHLNFLYSKFREINRSRDTYKSSIYMLKAEILPHHIS